MADHSENDEQESELRGRLLKRLGVAGVMVLILLGVLAFFDYLSSRREEVTPKVFTKPVPVSPKKEVSQPVKPALSDPATPEMAAPGLSGSEQPNQTPTTSEIAPPVETVTTTTTITAPAARPVAPIVKPSAQPIKTTPVQASKSTSPETAATTKPVPEATAAPVPVQAATSQPEPKQATQTRPTPPVLVAPPSLPRLLTGFAVQAGVFTNARKAEELHAKLALNGIPSTLEARVQVGPFKTRAEAEAAREKLKALGIDGMLIAPPSGRR
ncbi:MAG: Sporulation related protein [Proteobacteria bacterium]|nr:Sporulation related protein [Pseudomonadota bacterium]